MNESNRKPIFVTSESTQDEFTRRVAAAFQAAKEKNPSAKYEDSFQQVAKEFPTLYEVHAHKIGGDPHATIDAEPAPYFHKVSDLIFTELKKLNRTVQYGDAVATAADFYPALYETHLSERLGVSIPQPRIQLSDRRESTAKTTTARGVTLDKLGFARRVFPRLVQERLSELKAETKSATYEKALKETALHFGELYMDYKLSLGA